MSSPLVSVIVPVYNVERYVAQCLESIINQKYKNLEILVVDDGSTDNSSAICLDYAQKDPRIKYIRKENGGLSSARNKGLEHAVGKYVVYVDSDDYILPDMISECVASAEENGLDLVKSNFCRCNGDGKLKETEPETGKTRFFTPEQAMESFLNEPYSPRKAFKVSVWDALYLRERFDGITFPEGKIYEDGYYTPLVIINCRKAAHIDKSFYVYRINDKSIMGESFNKKSLKSLDDWEFIYKNVVPVMPQYKMRIAGIWAKRLVGNFEKIISDDSLDPDGVYTSQITDYFKENFDLFKEACGQGETLEKIEAAQKDKDAYYRKYILNKKPAESKIIKLKTFVKFLIDRRKELIKCIPLFIKKLYRKKRKIFLLGTPSYNNIGDHAIALGTRKFVKKYFPDCDYSEYDRLSDPSLERAAQAQIKAEIKKNDIILLIGGGNFGSLYPAEEDYRLKIIGTYTKNKIVFLSSTMCFEDTFFGRCRLKKSKTVYNDHPDLTLFLRDEKSFDEAQKVFDKTKCFFMPDFANMLIGKIEQPKARDGIYVCFRKDSERFFDDEKRDEFISFCKDKYKTDVGDNAFDSFVGSALREKKTTEYLRFFASHCLIVTDRFHGLIFSVITGTPCIALKNNNGKVAGGFYWFKNCKAVKLAENLEDAKRLVSEMYGIDFGELPDFTPYFDKAARIIKNSDFKI